MSEKVDEKKYIIFKTPGMELKIERDCLNTIDSTGDGLVIDLKNGTHILHTSYQMPNSTKNAITVAVNKFVNVRVLKIDLFNFQNPTSVEL